MIIKFCLISCLLFAATAGIAAQTVPLTSLDLGKMKQGYGTPQVNRSIREKPLSIAGRQFEHGVGTRANSSLYVDLSGRADRFEDFVGVDDAAGGSASLIFRL